MNLNQIRIIEACHKFLIGITNFEEELTMLNKLVCKSLSYYLRSILTLSPKKIPTSKKIILDMISSILQLKKNTLFIFFQMMNHLS